MAAIKGRNRKKIKDPEHDINICGCGKNLHKRCRYGQAEAQHGKVFNTIQHDKSEKKI